MRGRIWLVAGLVVVIVAVAVGVVLYMRDDSNDVAQGCKLVSPPAGAPVNDATGVRLAEQGYTRVGSLATSNVTIGAVLENPSDKVAYRTRVSFDVLGPEGQSVVADVSRRYQILEVPIILPGAKIPVGTALSPNRLAEVSSVTIKPVVNQWLAAGGPDDGLAPIAVTPLTDKITSDDQGFGHLAYRTTSANCTNLYSRGSSFVLRDTSGKIVGGGFSEQPQASGCDIDDDRFDNAFTTAQRGVPQTADLPKTEIASLCDVSPRPEPAGPSAPIN